jgi:RNA polymerase sigma-70 factor (ECF subfamily)
MLPSDDDPGDGGFELLTAVGGSDDRVADSDADENEGFEGGLATAGVDPAASPGAKADDAMLADLVHRIVRQDEAAFAVLYRSVASRVFAQVLRITRDTGCAEEVVEDVFWQVWRQAPRFDPARGCVLAWVRRMARSRALDALRAMGRNPLRMAVELDGDHAAQPVTRHDDPAQRVGSAQSAALVDVALAALDPLRRQLVALAFQRGYSQAEIAERTGLPLGTVKSHIRRALASMKTSIEAAESPRPSAQA